MIYLIIFIIVGFIIAFLDSYSIVDGIIGMLIGFVIGFLLWLIIGLPIGFAVPKVETIEEQEILALRDTSTVEGTKFLLAGSVKDELVYRYLVNTEKGQHVEEVKACYTYLKEGDYTPTVIKHNYVPKENWYWWFCIPISFSTMDNYTEFLIPKGTILREYEIDLK